MIRRVGPVALTALVLLVVTAGLVGPTGAATTRPLRVAVSLPAPGFWNGDSAAAGGFEAGLALALAERLGFDGVRVVDTTFARITRGRFAADVAVSEVTITPERERVVDFSGPYLAVDQAVVTTAARATGDGSLADRRWGVVRGTTGAATVRADIRPTAPAEAFADETAAFAAVRAGRVDAVMIDAPIAARAVADSGGALGIHSTVPTGERYGVVLPAGSPLRRKVTTALADLIADGTVARLASTAGFPDTATDPDFIT